MIGIIGGGLAGAGMAKTLFTNNKSFDWYLDNHPGASHISSGIINPVSGRNYTLAWNYDVYTEFANNFYTEDNDKFIHPINIKRKIYPSNQPEKQESIYIELKKYLKVVDDKKYLDISHAYQVQVPEFIEFWMKKCINSIVSKKIKSNDIDTKNASINGKHYDFIIFAEGIQVYDNPLFSHLPFAPNRGQALIFDANSMKFNEVLHDKKTLCRFGEHFWVGSSFERVELSEPLITEEMNTELHQALVNLIGNTDTENINQVGAFRSTTRDRRPIIGRHPDYPKMILFNGFGTKGASLIPYFSHELYQHLFYDHVINKEVDIARFYRVKSL